MGRPSVSPLDLPTPQGQLARSLGTHMEIKLEYDCRVRRWLYDAGNPLAILKSDTKGRSLKGGRGGGGRDGHEEGRQTTATAIREKMKTTTTTTTTTTEWGEKRGLNVNFRLFLGMSKMPTPLFELAKIAIEIHPPVPQERLARDETSFGRGKLGLLYHGNV